MDIEQIKNKSKTFNLLKNPKKHYYYKLDEKSHFHFPITALGDILIVPVGRTKKVSTAFLAIDHGIFVERNMPVLYETLIYQSGDTYRYNTYHEALANHNLIVSGSDSPLRIKEKYFKIMPMCPFKYLFFYITNELQ